ARRHARRRTCRRGAATRTGGRELSRPGHPADRDRCRPGNAHRPRRDRLHLLGRVSPARLRVVRGPSLDDPFTVLTGVRDKTEAWLAKSLQKGDEIFVAGEADLNGGLVMKNPDHEKVSLRPQHAARLVPIYPETEGLTSKWLRPKIQSLLQYADELEEFLPAELLARRGFLSRAAAVRQVHFPDSAP